MERSFITPGSPIRRMIFNCFPHKMLTIKAVGARILKNKTHETYLKTRMKILKNNKDNSSKSEHSKRKRKSKRPMTIDKIEKIQKHLKQVHQ